MTVYDVLEYLASGMTQQEVLADFPYLTEADLRACFAYAADREKRLMVVEAALATAVWQALEVPADGERCWRPLDSLP